MNTVIQKWTLITVNDHEGGQKCQGAFLVEKDFDPYKELERYLRTVSVRFNERKFVDWLLREGILTYAKCGNLFLSEPSLNEETGEKTCFRYDQVSLVEPFVDQNVIRF